MADDDSVPFPEYNLTLMFRQWNNAVDIVDIEEIKKRDRWIDVRNFVRAEDGSKITYELWLVHTHSGREVKMGEKGFEKNEHACIVVGTLGFRIFLPVWIVKAAGPTRKIQSSSKLRQFRK